MEIPKVYFSLCDPLKRSSELQTNALNSEAIIHVKGMDGMKVTILHYVEDRPQAPKKESCF
jgi:hypothetical protein